MEHVIDTVPDTVGKLTELKISVVENVLESYTVLEWSPGDLPPVKQLLSDAVQRVPESLCQLSMLTVLRISGCVVLSALPCSLGQLATLTTLELSYCQAVTALPDHRLPIERKAEA